MFVSEKFCAVKKEQLTTESKPLLTMYLANPRGFCAGVDRAVKIVEAALEVYGAPVYVRHEIVHNAWVVDSLRKKGAVFVEETEECPDDRPIVVSAHGAPRHVFGEIKKRNIICVDATCPLVTKVHMEARHHNQQGRHVVLIGHQGHPEVVGTLGQLDDEKHITLVETMQDVEKLEIPDSDNLACVTQTTLSVDDTAEILFALRVRFPNIIVPAKDDICYATTNRQNAVKAIAKKVKVLFVIGSVNSSNSRRLVEVGIKSGCSVVRLISSFEDIDWELLKNCTQAVGLTAGASAPEILSQEVIRAFQERFDLSIEPIKVAEENIKFKMPRMFVE